MVKNISKQINVPSNSRIFHEESLFSIATNNNKIFCLAGKQKLFFQKGFFQKKINEKITSHLKQPLKLQEKASTKGGENSK